MRTYVIINSSDVSSVDFSKVSETSADTLRYSLDGTKTFVKFEGDTLTEIVRPKPVPPKPKEKKLWW